MASGADVRPVDTVRGTAASTAPTVLEVHDLWVEYKTPAGWMQAVRGAELTIRKGEAVALIGESGSGKSTLGFALLRMLVRSARITRGSVRFTTGDGRDLNLLSLSDKEFRKIRWREIAMTFQAAQNSLNPVMRVKDTFWETAKTHGMRNRNEVRDRTLDLFQKVQLDPDRVYNAYPHELSGGMRQRVSIARALAFDSEIVLVDEPFSNLDAATAQRLRDLLTGELRTLDRVVVWVTHDATEAEAVARRTLFMDGPPSGAWHVQERDPTPPRAPDVTTSDPAPTPEIASPR